MIIIGQVSGKEVFEQHMELGFSEKQLFNANYFIEHSDQAWLVTSQKRNTFSCFNYGMIPFWSREAIYHYESPIEGSINTDTEKIKKRIILHPSYRRPIRESRCLIPVEYFIIPSEGDIPYLFYSMESGMFALAGIYDTWKENHLQKDIYQGFSLLTFPAPSVFKNAGVERLPLVIPVNQYKRWLNPDIALADITGMLTNNYERHLNAFPINQNLFRKKYQGEALCRQSGEMLREQPRESGIIANFLRSFRFVRGELHAQKDKNERLWRK